MSLQPPFALFVLSDNIDTEYINYSLRRAWRGNFMAAWDFWVATDNYDDMPKPAPSSQPSNRKSAGSTDTTPQGTSAPLRGSFNSPWVGRTLQECATWLHSAPTSAVNKVYFTAMNEHSRGDDTVLVCRITSGGKVEVEFFPQPTDVVAMHMVTSGGTKFDEKAASYRRSRRKDGKPDRSSGGSFH